MTYQALIPKVAAAFGLDYIAIGTPQKGYRNESYKITLASGEDVNLIFHKNEREAIKRIRSADLAASFLKGYGCFPIRTRYDKRMMKLSSGKNAVYAGVYTYLPGSTIPWEAYTKNHIKLLGWAMSDMHAGWAGLEASDVYITDELRALLARMEQYFADSGVKSALKDKLEASVFVNFHTYESLLGQFDQVLDPQEHILHMDLVRGNVLFGDAASSPWRIGDTSITGIIDFEKAATGHRIFDIARTLAFLLVDCAGKDRRSIYKYFLQSGYNKRGQSVFKRNDTVGGMPAYKVLDLLVSFFLLHDLYKFLKHTPYESLEDNHHFVRTRDILARYGMIRLDKD